MAFAAVWWTGWMQRKELALQREELSFQRDELSDTRLVFKRQNFESAFFAQIELVRDIRANAYYSGALGYQAFELASGACAKLLKVGNSDSEKAISDYITGVYINGEPFFGPYFRTLYHLFKLLDAQDYISQTERDDYASLARAQLGSQDLQLLAMNAATPLSGEFLPLIEKYGLLKHLPSEKRMSALFKGRIKDEAFMSAAERSKHRSGLN